MADRAALPPQDRGRIAGLDALRGLALCGMVAFHLAWDLADAGWPVTNPATSAPWTLFGHVVAATFLFVSGVGLALARPKGLVFALRRLLVLAAAGGAVSAATLWLFPAEPILFGILHCIAVTDALALAALPLPASARVALALAAAAAPSLPGSPRLDGWIGQGLGLSRTLPVTLDYRPVLPWLAAVLAGTVAGDTLRRIHRGGSSVRYPALGGLAWAGRNSLSLYLVHQPVIIGCIMLVGVAVPPPPADADIFMRQCRIDCIATGADPSLCGVACACTATRLAHDVREGASRLSSGHLAELEAACRSDGP